MAPESTTQWGRPRTPRPVPDSAGSEASEEGSVVNEWVTWGILGICLAAWAIVGFFLWIPRVLRSIFLFSLALVEITVTDSTADDAGNRLRKASEFYTRGFARAVEGIRSSGRRKEETEAPDGGWRIQPRLILGELAWAIGLWYLIFWGLGLAPWTPTDAITYLADVRWSRVWADFVGTFRAIPDLVLD